MPIATLSRIVAKRSLPRPAVVKRTGASGPTAEQLLTTIGAYIPTEVTTAYVAVAGGMATIEAGVPVRTRLLIAIGVTVLASFAAWIIGHRQAVKKAAEDGVPVPSALHSLGAGWYEIAAAGIAFFAWAAAMPSSWVGWGANVVYAPALLVFATSLVIGGLAVLLNRGS